MSSFFCSSYRFRHFWRTIAKPHIPVKEVKLTSMYLSKENFKFSSLTRYFSLTRRNWKDEKQISYGYLQRENLIFY